MKKIVPLALFLGLIPWSCGCPETKDYYSTIQEFSISEEKNFVPNYGQMNTIESKDTLSFVFQVSKSEISENWTPRFISFLSSAYATSPCPDDQLLGWSNKIDSILIVSDSSFLGIPPGHKLNEKFLAFIRFNYQGNYQLSFSSINFGLKCFNREIDCNPGYPNGSLRLLLKEKPSLNSSLKFSFSFYSKGVILHSVESLIISFKQ